MIVIIDYEMGNVGSTANMLDKLGHRTTISRDPEVIKNADKIILPGVGAFDHGVQNLRKFDLIDTLNWVALEAKKPILGICVGMQLLSDGSDEGELPGLGWIPGRTRRFDFKASFGDGRESLKIPHMGWNTLVEYRKDHPLFADMDFEEIRYYFVHSYHVEPNDPQHILGQTNYGYPFASMIGRDNIMGTQFHPEKSHKFGMKLLSNFAKYAPC